MSQGKKIAEGWEAEIYEWSGGTTPKVLKLFFSDDERQAREEREITSVINNAGGPATAIFGDVITVDGRYGFVMERVIGRDMDQQLISNIFDWKMLALLGRQLGKLHASLHRETSIHLQRSRKELLASSIRRAKSITDSEKNSALKLLDGLPEGDRLCHGDLHFGNVIDGDKSQFIIDWGNASMGDPLADVARTKFLIETGWIGTNTITTLLSVIVRRLTAILNRYYSEGYFLESGLNPSDVDQWRIVTAAARLAEGLPKRQRKHIVKIVREGL